MADSAYACTHCGVTKPTEQLTSIADMLPAARDVAHGLSRRAGGGNTAGKPGSRLPFDLGATSRLDTVQVALTAHVDHIGTIRGITRPWFEPHVDPITAAAQWLADHGNLEWMRHRDNADQFLTDVEACARIVAGIAKGPSAQRYLGPCGARIPTESDQNGVAVSAECPGDIYARDGALSGTCRECGATITVAERRAWLDELARAGAFSAAEIADAYRINVKTIRSWANRGHLRSYWRTDSGIIAAFDADPPDGETRERLHYVGDVLDLAAADAARKAEDQARRARRATRREDAA